MRLSLASLALGALVGCHQTAHAPASPKPVEPPNSCVPASAALDERPSWGMEGGDSSGQRNSRAVGPAVPGVRWVHEMRFPYFSGLAVGADRTVYAGSKFGVHAIDASGQRVWTQRSQPGRPATPAVASGGTVHFQYFSEGAGYYSNDLHTGGFVAIDRCGKPTWTKHAPKANLSSVILDGDGAVYAVAHPDRFAAPEALTVTSATGSLKWSAPSPPGDTFTALPVLDRNGTVYIGTLKGQVLAFSAKGVLRWKRQFSGRMSQLAASDWGAVYAVVGSSMVAFDSEGYELFHTSSLGRTTPSLALAANGHVVVAGDSGLVAFSKDGEKLWTYEQRGTPRPPVIDAEGTAYAVFNQRDFGRVIAVTSEGEPKWQFYTAGADSLAMGGDGALYVAAGKRVYALEQCAQPPCPDDGSAVAASNPEAKEWTPAEPRLGGPPRVKVRPMNRERHDGYDVYPQCRPGVTAIVREQGEDFPWYPGNSDAGPAKRSAVRTEFRGRALAAIALSSHSNGFGVACLEPRGAFIVWVSPGQDVPAAARAVGQWLKRENLRGEIDIQESDASTAW